MRTGECTWPRIGLGVAAVVGILLAAGAAPVSAATAVPLTVTERLGIDRRGEPVTMGVPIPKGELRDVRRCRLLRDGREVPAQFRAAGLWRPTKSIRWLLVDLQTDITANETQTYTLEYGDDVVQRAKPPHVVRIKEDGDAYTVETGAATFRISKRVFSLFEEVRLADGAVVVARPAADKPRFGAVVKGLKPTVTRAIPAPANTGRSHLIYVTYAGKAGLADYALRFTSDTEYEVTRTTLQAPPPAASVRTQAPPPAAGTRAGTMPALRVGTGAFLKDFTSADGSIAIPANAWLRYAYPKKGDVYTFRTIPAGAAAPSEGVFETTVLERGPLRSVIRVKGSFGPAATPVLEYTARYHFHAGSGRVTLLFTLENNDHGGRTNTGNARNANIGGINCVFFDEMRLALPLALGQKKTASLLGDPSAAVLTAPLTGTIELYQDSDGGEHWNRYRDAKYHPRPTSYVTFQGYRILTGAKQTGAGRRAVGWLDLSDGAKGLSVGVRDFWQTCPKALAAEPTGSVRVGLFPGRYAGDFPFRSGEHKTHEVLFLFHGGDAKAARGEAAARAFSDPLRLEPSAEWFAKTRALWDVHPYDPEHYKAYEARNLSAVSIWPKDLRRNQRLSILTRREQFALYGWMDYGDVAMDFEGGSGQWGMKYDLDFQMVAQWARTLKPEWWRVFSAADRHARDIDIHHQPHYPGLHYVKGGVWAHSLHNEPGHRNPNRNYNHFTKDLCFGARGTAALHYLTGDWKAREACLEIAENALARYMSPQADPGAPEQNNRMGVRGDACTLNRLLEGYLLSGERRLLDRARWQIKACAFDGKPAKHRPTSLWSSVFYMMALSRYVETFPEDKAARRYLLAHIETLRQAAHPETGILYTITPQPDGSVTGTGQCSHYNIMAADALAIGYRLTGEMKYMETARRCFAYGVKNACWRNGPATYFHIHSANGATHGSTFMTVDSALRAKP